MTTAAVEQAVADGACAPPLNAIALCGPASTMETENTEAYAFLSSSGSMELEADARALVVRDRVALRPIFVGICVLPLAAIAGYALFSRGTTGASIVIGGGLLAYAAYILDSQGDEVIWLIFAREANAFEQQQYEDRRIG